MAALQSAEYLSGASWYSFGWVRAVESALPPVRGRYMRGRLAFLSSSAVGRAMRS